MEFTVWIRKQVTLYIGGNPNAGQAPVVTATLKNPQILIDPERGTVIILETK